jgi:hypothetical protein
VASDIEGDNSVSFNSIVVDPVGIFGIDSSAKDLFGFGIAGSKHPCELLQARVEAVNTECCDDASEDCGGGMPKSCDNGAMRLECSGPPFHKKLEFSMQAL